MRISDWSSDVCSSDLLVDALQGLDEAQIHHLVRFVEHENLDIAKMHGLLIDKVEQTAWRCHENVDASLHLLDRSEEHTSELQSLMRISYAVFCLKKKKQQNIP